MKASRAGRLLWSLVSGLVLLLGLARGSAAAELPPGITQVRTVGGFTEYQLDNGLQLLLMPVASHPNTLVSITYRVGSRHEGAGETGMAHLLEHVTFRGTRSFADLGGEMQRRSVRVNGTTSYDRTNYIDSFPPGADTLREVLRLEASRMVEANLAEADFAKEKPIVLNEMGLRAGNTTAQLMRGLTATAFRQHPYGRPVIGFSSDIENLSLPTLRAFYERHYRPDNALLLVAGAFDPAQALAAVAETFGPLARPAAPLPVLEFSEPTQQGPRLMTLRTPETGLALAYRTPGMAHAHAPALMVLNQLLPNAQNTLTQSKDRPVTLNTVSNGALTRDPFLLGMILQLPTEPSDSAAARAALESLEEHWIGRVERLRRQAGIEPAIRMIANGLAQRLRRSMGEPAQASAEIANAFAAGDWRLPFKLIEDLNVLKPGEVLELSSTYLREQNRSVVRGVTDPAVKTAAFEEASPGLFSRLFSSPVEVPAVKDAAAAVGELRPVAAPLRGEALDTDPQALARRVQRYVLPSGLRVAELAKNSAGEQVSVHLQLRWGKPGEMTPLQGWRALAPMLDEGAAGRSSAEIRQIKQRLQADIRIVSGPQGVYAIVTARKSTLLASLSLLKDMLSGPTLAEAALDRERNTVLARLESMRRGPGMAAYEPERQFHNQHQGLQAGMAGYTLSVDEQIAIWRQLSLAEVRDFHRRFWSANDAAIAIVGHVPENFRATVESLFGAWKKEDVPSYERLVLTHKPEPAARFVANAADGAAVDGQGAATVSYHQALALNRQSPDYPAFMLGAQILAANGQTSGTRLAERLRAQDATSYNVASTLLVPSDGDRASLRLQATGAPANLGRIESAMSEEIERLLAGGVSAAELDLARQQVRIDRRQQLANDAGLAVTLLNQLLRQTGFEQMVQDEERLNAVTPEQVRETLRRLLDPQAWVVVVTGLRP